jgi:uncharacterized protein YggE
MTESRPLPLIGALALALGAAALVAGALVAVLLRPGVTTIATAPAAPPPPDPGGPRGFTVNGTATIEALPDLVELVATIEVERRQPSEAAAEARARQTALFAALEAAGVARTDVALSALRLAPVHEVVDPRRQTTRVRGFAASVALAIVSRDFDRVPDLVGRVAAAGVGNVSTRLRVADLPALKRKVREKAAAAAREKAAEIAGTLGVDLGKVRAIAESPGDGWGWNGYWSNEVIHEDPGAGAHGVSQGITLTIAVTYDLA